MPAPRRPHTSQFLSARGRTPNFLPLSPEQVIELVYSESLLLYIVRLQGLRNYHLDIRRFLLKLADIDGKFALNLEEEVVEPYKTILARLQYVNVKLKWPLTQIYPPMKLPEKGEFLRLRLGRYFHAE